MHVNHGIRKTSQNEQIFVSNYCNSLNIPLSIYKAKLLRIKSESMEMWARRVRQDSFELAKKEFNCDFILTGHQMNDKIETILMHLDDGCRIEGLKGIPKQNQTIIRPLIDFTRNQISEYINKHKLKYIDDSSNTNISIKRNFIRHKIIKPWAEQSEDLLLRFDNLSKKASIAVNKMNLAISSLSNIKDTDDHIIKIKDDSVHMLTLNQKVRLIKKIIGDEKVAWRSHRWISLEQWLKVAKTGMKFKLSAGWILLRDRTDVILKSLNIGYDGFSLVVNKVDKYKKFNDYSKEVIDASAVEGKKIKFRKWRVGDYFQPLGMNGRKKISDFLIDQKVDSFTKEEQMVVTANSEIIWVCGYRISENVKVNKKTTKYLELSLVPELS